jgi:hypothetical protein
MEKKPESDDRRGAMKKIVVRRTEPIRVTSAAFNHQPAFAS